MENDEDDHSEDLFDEFPTMEDAEMDIQLRHYESAGLLFYKQLIKNVEHSASLVRFHQDVRARLFDVGFGPFILGTALFVCSAIQELLELNTFVKKCLDALPNIIDATQFRETVQSYTLLNQFEFGKIEHQLFRLGLDEIANASSLGDVKDYERHLHAMSEYLLSVRKTNPSIHFGQQLASFSWAQAFFDVTSVRLDTFNNRVRHVAKEMDQSFIGLAEECLQYVQSLLGHGDLSYDEHYVHANLQGLKNVEVPVRRSTDFAALGDAPVRDLFALKVNMNNALMRGHCLRLLDRVTYRKRSIEQLRQLLIAKAKEVDIRLNHQQLSDFVVATCRTFDARTLINLLDLEFLGVDEETRSSIFGDITESEIEDYRAYLAESESGDDDSDMSVTGSDFGDDEEEEGEEDDDFSWIENDEEEDVESIEVIEQPTMNKPEKEKRKPPPHSSDAWVNYFHYLEQRGYNLRLIYEHLTPVINLLDPNVNAKVEQFLNDYAALFIGQSTTEENNAMVIEMLTELIEEDDGRILQKERDDFLARGRSLFSDDFYGQFLAEIAARANLIDKLGDHQWRTDPCRDDPAYHVYRIFYLEYERNLFAHKFEPGMSIEEFADLRMDFANAGYPTLVFEFPEDLEDIGKQLVRHHQRKKEYFADVELEKDIADLIETRPGLSLVDQFWYLLPEEIKAWFRGAAEYLAAHYPKEFPQGKAWWHDRRIPRGNAAPWKRGEALFRLVENLPLQKDSVQLPKREREYAIFFRNTITEIREIVQLMEDCPVREEIANIAGTRYCAVNDDDMDEVIEQIITSTIEEIPDQADANLFQDRFKLMIKYIDSPLTLDDTVKHNDGTAHRHIAEFQQFHNILLALTCSMRHLKSTRKIIVDFKVSLKRALDTDDESGPPEKKARMKQFLFRRFRDI